MADGDNSGTNFTEDALNYLKTAQQEELIMNEKKFLKPEIEIINFNDEDVIFTSGPDGQIASVDIDGMPLYEQLAIIH